MILFIFINIKLISPMTEIYYNSITISPLQQYISYRVLQLLVLVKLPHLLFGREVDVP